LPPAGPPSIVVVVVVDDVDDTGDVGVQGRGGGERKDAARASANQCLEKGRIEAEENTISRGGAVGAVE